MLEDITDAILSVLNSSCSECGITYEIIDMRSLNCLQDNPAYMIFSARMKSTSETDSGTLISLVEEWVGEGPSINVTETLMTVHSECYVVTSSLNDTICYNSVPVDPTAEPTIIYAVAGGVAGLLAVIIVIAVATATCYSYRRYLDGNVLRKLRVFIE